MSWEIEKPFNFLLVEKATFRCAFSCFCFICVMLIGSLMFSLFTLDFKGFEGRQGFRESPTVLTVFSCPQGFLGFRGPLGDRLQLAFKTLGPLGENIQD